MAANEPFYKRLNRLFRSGPAIRRRIKGQDYKNFYDNTVVQSNLGYYGASSYKRESSPFSISGAYGILDRNTRYAEFAEMDVSSPEINSALDVFADEACAGDEVGRSLHIHSNNPQIQSALEELFYEVANVEFDARRWFRNLVKNGDFFLYVETMPDYGVVKVEPIPVNEIDREEGFDPQDPYAIRFKLLSRGGKYLENWQILHFRILSNEMFIPFGTSFLESARRVYRQLCVSKGTPVWVKGEGYKQIEFVKPNDTVYSFDFDSQKVKETKVKHVIEMGVQNLVRITTSHRQIDVTPNHGLLVCDKNGNFYYKKAEELIVSGGKGGQTHRNSDKLILPLVQSNIIPTFELDKNEYSVKLNTSFVYDSKGIVKKLRDCNLNVKNTISFLKGKRKISYTNYKVLTSILLLEESKVDFYLKKSKYKSHIPNQILTITNDFSRFLGFMLGDGWNNNHGMGIALGIYEEQNQFYLKLIKNLFPGIPYRRSRKENTRSERIDFDSKEIGRLLTQLGFKTGFANKRVPKWVFELPQEYRISFIKGICDADGCSSKDGSESMLTLSNKDLIEDVKNLCWQSGIKTAKTVKLVTAAGQYFDKSFNKIITRKDAYKLHINFNNISTETYKFEAVNKIEQINSGETYDLEVDDIVHNFTANGLIVHNTMMEDAMLVYRVVRSPERRVFYIDVSAIHPNDIPTYMEAVKETMRGSNVIDRISGRQDIRYNPVSVDDDYFLPARPNGQTKIETLAGGQHVSATEDVEYLQKKLIAALKVPRAYLTYDEAISSKATLASEDIRFSRTIANLQKIVVAELNKLAIIHLFSKGFDGEDLLDFELRFSNPSTIALQQKLQLISSRIETASKAWELSKETGIMDMEYIQSEILGFRSNEIVKMRIGSQQDQIRIAELKALAEKKPVTNIDQDSITDPFNSTNYELPTSPSATQLPSVAGDEKGSSIKINLPANTEPSVKKLSLGNKAPINVNPTPNLDAAKRRNNRSKEFTGRSAMNMPDFKTMLSPNNRYAKDPFDMEFLKNPLQEVLISELRERTIPRNVGPDMYRTLKKLDESWKKNKEMIDIDIVAEPEIASNNIDNQFLLLENELKGLKK